MFAGFDDGKLAQPDDCHQDADSYADGAANEDSDAAGASGAIAGLPKGFRFKGAISFAGAIINTSGAPTFASEPCPILLLHGDADQAVAYRHLGAFGKGLWGSDYVARVLAGKGYPHCIYRFKGRAHDVAAYHTAVWPIQKEFLEQSVVLGKRRTVDAYVDDPSLPTWGAFSLDDIYQR